MRLSFMTQFKIEFLLQFTGCRKVLGKMPALYHTRPFSTVSAMLKQASYLCVPSSLFCSSRKVHPLVSCIDENYFSWQLVEIRLPYHLGPIYGKRLTLTHHLEIHNVCCTKGLVCLYYLPSFVGFSK